MMENSKIKCPNCDSSDTRKNGIKGGKQQFICKNCDRYFLEGAAWYNLNKKGLNMEKSSLGITLDNFRSKNDPKYIVSEGLRKLTQDVLYKTSEFIQLIGLPVNFGSSKLMDMPGLERYYGKCSSGTYWSHPDVILQLKNERVLR